MHYKNAHADINTQSINQPISHEEIYW